MILTPFSYGGEMQAWGIQSEDAILRTPRARSECCLARLGCTEVCVLDSETEDSNVTLEVRGVHLGWREEVEGASDVLSTRKLLGYHSCE